MACFQVLLNYNELNGILQNWTWLDISIKIIPILKQSIVVNQGSLYYYREDIRIWKKLEDGYTIEHIILLFLTTCLNQFRFATKDGLHDDLYLQEHYSTNIKKLRDGTLPGRRSFIGGANIGLNVESKLDL